jgi:hydrogenase expression/formation protein HypC
MCLAIPGKIIKINGNTAKVEYGGVIKEANIEFVDAKVGDYILVHAGFAIQIVPEELALASYKEILKL